MKIIFFALLVLGIAKNTAAHPLEDAPAAEERFKRSLFTDPVVSLTGMEKISKRSVDDNEDDMDTAATNAFLPAFARRRGKRSAELEEMNTAENVFLPAFARRIYRGKRATVPNNYEDLEGAETHAFLPAFARRNFRRNKRSVDLEGDDLDTEETHAFLPSFARRNRGKRSADLDEDLEPAATNAFLPAFARRNIRRNKRSVDDDDLEPAATNAFLPGFARRNIRRG